MNRTMLMWTLVPFFGGTVEDHIEAYERSRAR